MHDPAAISAWRRARRIPQVRMARRPRLRGRCFTAAMRSTGKSTPRQSTDDEYDDGTDGHVGLRRAKAEADASDRIRKRALANALKREESMAVAPKLEQEAPQEPHQTDSRLQQQQQQQQQHAMTEPKRFNVRKGATEGCNTTSRKRRSREKEKLRKRRNATVTILGGNTTVARVVVPADSIVPTDAPTARESS